MVSRALWNGWGSVHGLRLIAEGEYSHYKRQPDLFYQSGNLLGQVIIRCLDEFQKSRIRWWEQSRNVG